MRWPAWLRSMVYLRRVARSLESIDASLTTMVTLAQAEDRRAHPPRRKSQVTVDYFDQAAADKRWRDEQVAMGREVD